jgi:hypothetical protein
LKIKTKNQSKKTNQALTTKDMKVQLFTFVWLLVACCLAFYKNADGRRGSLAGATTNDNILYITDYKILEKAI